MVFQLRKIPNLLLAYAFFLGVAFAESRTPESFYGKKIAQTEFIGLKRIEAESVLNKIYSKAGQVVVAEKLRVDVQTLFNMGYFEDIQILAEESTADPGQARLKFMFKERPVIREIEFDGNSNLSDSDLKGIIKLKEWSILDPSKAREDVQLLTKHYEDKGFYLTRISYRIEKTDKADELKLIYTFKDYEKVRIKKISFLGNQRFSDDQLKNVFAETKEGGFFSFVSGSGNFKESGFKTDLQRLLYWYLDHGYVKFKYDSPVVSISDDKRWMTISVHLDEGEVYNIGDIAFSGDLLFTREELGSWVKMTQGQQFSITKRTNDIQLLTEKYQDLGYAFVNVIPKMDIKEEERRVDIDYQFEKGNLAYFGEINITGNTKTHDKVIRRELRVKEGELFHGTRLRKSKENVERLGFFQPNEVIFNTVPPKGRTDLVNLEISVKERQTGSVSLSAGYGSLQGVFFSTQVSEMNLMGRGQNVNLLTSVARGRRNNAVSIGFTDPYAFDTRWSLGLNFSYATSFIPFKYITRKIGFQNQLGHPIGDYTYGYITYKRENLDIEELDIPEPDAFDLQEIDLDKGSLSSVVWSLIRDKRNNRLEATGGFYQSFSTETAGLGGEKKFVAINANQRFYQPLFGDVIFRTNVQAGQISSLDANRVPPSERFYLGGPQSMRGFQYYTVGPFRERTTSTGQRLRIPLGGTYQFYTNLELEQPLVKEAGLKMVGFFDIGNAWADYQEASKFVLRKNWGFGIRWFSPLGILRFEWGFPLARRPTEDSAVFQFFIGPSF